MESTKRYYWMKMKPDFFLSKEIKKLRKLAGGDTFTIIYLKMILKSLPSDGKLFHEGVEDTFAEEIALDIDEDPDNVKLTLAFLISHGMIEEISDGEIFLPGAIENTGSECSSAARVRRLREQKALQCNTLVTNCNTEKEIDIEKEIEKEIELDDDCQKAASNKQNAAKKKTKKPDLISFGEFGGVKLTQEQYDRLVSDYGQLRIDDYVKKIDEWMKMYGKKPYKDFNLAIRNWLNRDGVSPVQEVKANQMEGIV